MCEGYLTANRLCKLFVSATASCWLLGCASAKPNVIVKQSFDLEISRIAVLDFTDAPGADAGHSGEVVASAVTNAAMRVDQWQIVERSRIRDILAEQDFQASGLLDSSSAVKCGKVLGVDGIIVGSVSQYRIGSVSLIVPAMIDINQFTVSFNFRLIDVRTSDVILSATGTGTSTVSLEDATDCGCKQIFDEIIEKLTM